MTPEQIAFRNHRLKEWAKRIQRFADLNAPDPIISHAIVCLYRVALGYMPRYMAMNLAELLTDDGRHYIGLCRTENCDNETRLSRRYCESCEAKWNKNHFVRLIEDDEEEQLPEDILRELKEMDEEDEE